MSNNFFIIAKSIKYLPMLKQILINQTNYYNHKGINLKSYQILVI